MIIVDSESVHTFLDISVVMSGILLGTSMQCFVHMEISVDGKIIIPLLKAVECFVLF